ncbi:hypothetical protein [Aureliella helgolandensis]|uniref:hypothetical protein n=1 Tax=Aureliella helgolandensis TaxID=2527968 RepID=UPI0011A44B2F|nr:hypothetical protein [Aureliella helgolandensis]
MPLNLLDSCRFEAVESALISSPGSTVLYRFFDVLSAHVQTARDLFLTHPSGLTLTQRARSGEHGLDGDGT